MTGCWGWVGISDEDCLGPPPQTTGRDTYPRGNDYMNKPNIEKAKPRLVV